MQMVGSGTARASFDAYRVACMQPLAHLNKVAGVMAVEGFESVGITQDDAIAVALVRP